jgi:hypothetical protein
MSFPLDPQVAEALAAIAAESRYASCRCSTTAP